MRESHHESDETSEHAKNSRYDKRQIILISEITILIRLTLKRNFSIRVDSTKLQNILEVRCFLHQNLYGRSKNLIWKMFLSHYII